MKNKSYKKILALTLAATLVGGNAVATFATESTTDAGVTASEDRILGDLIEKPIKVTFKMSGDLGTAYFEATQTTESSDEVEAWETHSLPKISLPVDCELTGWEVSGDDAQYVKKLSANQTTYTYDTVKGYKNPVITAVIKKKETVKEAKATLYVHYVDENNVPLAGDGSIVTLTKTGKVGEKATFNGTDFVAPEGYTLVENDLSVDVAYGSDKDINVTVKKLEEVKPEEAKATLYVHYVDENNVPLAGDGSIVKLTKTGEVGDTATFSGTDFEAPEGYTLVENDLSVDVAYGSDADVNVKVKKLEEVKPEVAEATLYVHYVDENNVPLDGQQYIVKKTKSGKVGEKATFSGTDFEAPTGYTLVENDLSVEVAYGSDADINVTVKKLETVTPDQPTTPEQPGTSEQPGTPDQSATDTKTDKTDKTDKKDDKKTDKKTDKKSDKKTDKKSDKKKTPKTGDTSTPIVYMVTLIGAAVAAVLALIKRRKF